MGPGGDGPPAVDGPPPGAGPAADKPKGKKVVVCKYVRKPGVAEIFSHIIVVSENALLGKGFAGTFPFPFSDAHFKSVAVRYAAKGEQAKEVSPSVCPAGETGGEEEEPPPGEEPPAGEPPAGGVGGVTEEGGPAVSADEALPNTGAPSNLQLLAMLGGLCSLAGVWLVTRGVRERRQTT